MKQLLFLIMMVLIGAGCKRDIPGDLIQPAEMEQILYNIHIADGIVGDIPYPDSAKKTAAAYYGGIYKKFDVDSALFAKSMNYYYSNPVVMTKMYEGIVARLEKEKKALDDEETKRQLAISNKFRRMVVTDSLKRLLFVDTTRRDTFNLDTIKINYAKMSKTKIKSIQAKNDSIRVKIDSAKKAADKKKEFIIQPRRAFFWGKN